MLGERKSNSTRAKNVDTACEHWQLSQMLLIQVRHKLNLGAKATRPPPNAERFLLKPL